jgi:hypothetical protein
VFRYPPLLKLFGCVGYILISGSPFPDYLLFIRIIKVLFKFLTTRPCVNSPNTLRLRVTSFVIIFSMTLLVNRLFLLLYRLLTCSQKHISLNIFIFWLINSHALYIVSLKGYIKQTQIMVHKPCLCTVHTYPKLLSAPLQISSAL